MKKTKLLSVILTALMLISMIPLTASAYSKEQATLTFGDSGITETVSGSGYSVSDTTLTINEAGTYRVKGSCSEGAIVVKGGLSGVTLILDNLTLTSTSTAPIVVKKSSSVLLKLAGTNTITDNETLDESNADFEGAAIKVKSGSTLTIFGDGTLNAVGTPKNAIKGAATSSLIIDGGTINATAANNGVAFDGSVVINAGNINVTSGNDGIKAQPDEGDTDSAGTLTINGGTFNINSQGDGIVAAENLTITNGDFTIKTLDGYKSSSFNKDTMSCKGLKVSSNNVADENNPTNTMTISGGTFSIDTADDAVHSDGYITITGGTFDICTGDDGVHADATLNLGTENGYARDPEITINSSYEGLEGSVVNVYSGKFYVVASDDGINSAGGSSNGTDPMQGGQDQFRPGGQPGQGGPGQGGPGQGGQGQQPGQQNSGSSNYSLNIYGGNLYVNCTGDGLDSNGSLTISGGNVTVLSQSTGGDNSPLDCDGAMAITGGTVFAAGTNPMNENPTNSSQNYFVSTTSRQAGTVINITQNGSVVHSEKLLRNVNYILYSDANTTSSNTSVSTANSVTSCKSNTWAHNWDSGTVVKAATSTETGLIKFTCTGCNEVEYKIIPKLATVTEYVEGEASSSEAASSESGSTSESSSSESSADTGYNVNFLSNGNCSINVYYTKDYTTADETNVSSAVSRNGDTGAEDSSGDGQVNFTIVTDEGYEVDSVSVSGSYKNLKGPEETGLSNTYRITKIAGDLKVTVSTKQTESGSDSSEAASSESVSSESQTSEQSESSENGTSEQSSEESGSSESSASEQSSEESASSENASDSAKTTVKITAAKTKIKAGNTTLVKATVKNASGKTVYTSSNKAVATVSASGKVKAKKAGSVIISAKNNGVTAKLKITVVKKANTAKITAKLKTVKYGRKTTVKAITVKKAKGKVTYSKTSGNKKITVNKKTGRITVKKGLKKGVYKVKVKVTAKGTGAYKSKSKTVTVKIKVK